MTADCRKPHKECSTSRNRLRRWIVIRLSCGSDWKCRPTHARDVKKLNWKNNSSTASLSGMPVYFDAISPLSGDSMAGCY